MTETKPERQIDRITREMRERCAKLWFWQRLDWGEVFLVVCIGTPVICSIAFLLCVTALALAGTVKLLFWMF